MTIAEYRKHILRTLPDLGKVLKDKVVKAFDETELPNGIAFELGMLLGGNSNKLNYMHMATGLASEVGELVECAGTDLQFNVDRVHLGEEIGDLYWYLCNYANMRSINLPEDLRVSIPEEQCLDFLIIKVGALVDIIKKYAAYNKELDHIKETTIVCDVRLALLVIEQTYDLNGGEIRKKNIAKLSKRYPVEFSEFLANNRDTNEERKALD